MSKRILSQLIVIKLEHIIIESPMDKKELSIQGKGEFWSQLIFYFSS